MAIRIRSSAKNRIPDLFGTDERAIQELRGRVPYITFPLWGGLLTLLTTQGLIHSAEAWVSLVGPDRVILLQLSSIALCVAGLVCVLRAGATRMLVVTNKRLLLLQHSGREFCTIKGEIRLGDAQAGRVSLIHIPAGSLPFGRCAYVQLRVQFTTGTYRMRFMSFSPADRSGRDAPELKPVFDTAKTLKALQVLPSVIDRLDKLVSVNPAGD